MSIKVSSKRPLNLTAMELVSLSRLRLHDGFLWQSLTTCRKHFCPYDMVFIARKGKKIVAWALVESYRKKYCRFMTYVMTDYRRQGIGTILAKAADRFAEENRLVLGVYYHTPEAAEFFRSVKLNKDLY